MYTCIIYQSDKGGDIIKSCYTNPFRIAGNLGQSIAGEIGRKAFQELELAYVNSILPKFSNNTKIRTKQHILLHWNQSFFKSTIITEFCKCLPDNINQINITSNSPEMLFGTITDDNKIVLPLFANKQIATVTELSTFIPNRNPGLIINPMNKILEMEPVERQLLKFGRRDVNLKEISRALKNHVLYEKDISQLSYVPNVTIFAASRPLENRVYTILKTSGYLYRHHIIQYDLSNTDAKYYLKQNFTPNGALYAPLKNLNEKIQTIKIKQICTPSYDTIAGIMDNLIDIVQKYTKNETTKLTDYIDIRTRGDIIREIAARAVIRTLVNNNFSNIDSVKYTQEDIDYIKDNSWHFIEPKINPLFTDNFSSQSKTRIRPIEIAMKSVLEFLKDFKVKGRGQIDNHVLQKTGVSKATLSNGLKRLVDEGKISKHGHGFYQIKKN